MLYSDWEHRDTQVTSDLIRKGIEEAKINAELRAEIAQLKQRPWVGLTENELLHIGVATGLERAAVEMISNKLKELNT